ncbi:MAG: TIM barrel protein [Acidobacteriota bacterium]|nr:TIM barrel protein [Acidobacteriota bacterium]
MSELTRREALAAGAATIAAGLGPGSTALDGQTVPGEKAVMKGRLKQSVSRWCYQKIPMPEFCKAVAGMGVPAVDLLPEADWAVVRDFGLICSMGNAGGGSIADGLNVRANHDRIVKNFEQNIPKAAAQKVPNVITFFGNRRGMSDSEAIANCIEGLNRVKKVAEESGVTICVELLNSKVDHKDYHGDHTAFGVEIVKAVASPRVKLLYDIYHMQIMEGDIIRTIRDNKEYLAHFHTGGVPGRHELDDTQEMNWRTVCAAIADMGFQGYLAHEFVPTRDPLTSLREAVVLCDV